MNLFALSSILIAISSFAFGLLVYIKGKTKRQNILWFLFAISVAVWGFGGYKVSITQNLDRAFYWWQIIHAGVIFIPVLFWHFVYEFLGIKRKKAIALVYFAGLFFLCTNFSGYLVRDLRFVFSSFYWPVPSILYGIFAIFWFGSIIYAHIELIKAFKGTTGIKRSQIKYFFLATVVGFAGGSLSFLPVFHIDLYPILNFTVPLYPPIMCYAIIRYRLMDIRLAVKRSSIYLISLVLSVAGGALAWLIIGNYLVALLIAVIIIQPIKWALQKLANKYFFVSLYSQQETLKKLSEKLTTIIDLDRLLNAVAVGISKILEVDRVAIVLKELDSTVYKIEKSIGFKEENGISLVKDNFLTQQHLQKTRKPIVYEELKLIIKDAKHEEIRQSFIKLRDNMKRIEAVLCLPLISKNKLEGIIILGKKLFGDAYTKEDLDLLGTLANQISTAIENAKLYDQVRDLSTNLQEKVEEQTKSLKELLAMKSEFLNTVSHQLRTPTTIFRSMLSMITEGSLTKEQKEEWINDCYGAANRLLIIIEGILEANTFEGRTPSFDFKLCDLEKVLQDAVNIFPNIAQKKGVILEYQKPKETLPQIMADAGWLRSVFIKVIDNAIWYTRKNGKVTVSAEYNKDQNTVSIKVQDTGIGLTQEDKKILFKKFSRGRGSWGMNVNSSGLGLYIVKRIVEGHHGEIIAESEGEDKGSTFIITLPMTQEM